LEASPRCSKFGLGRVPGRQAGELELRSDWTGRSPVPTRASWLRSPGDTVKAKTAYQDFLTLWKNADPDIAILKEAKAEYAKLQ
jgi:hypothetical protein